MSERRVTVIICTTAQAVRENSLRRAIDSVLASIDCEARPLVVINGSLFAPTLRAELEQWESLDCVYLETGNVGLAQKMGVLSVSTPFFCFLDDDDYLFPEGIARRLDALIKSPEIDFVVGNGRLARANREDLAYDLESTAGRQIEVDPLAALLNANWLASCAGMFRRSTIGVDIFDGSAQHFEWTYYAFKLCLWRKGKFINDCVFRVSDTLGSASKGVAYLLAEVALCERLIDLTRAVRPDLEKPLRNKRDRSINSVANELGELGRSREGVRILAKAMLTGKAVAYFPSLIRLIISGMRSRGG